jgi:hypothetical protein
MSCVGCLVNSRGMGPAWLGYACVVFQSVWFRNAGALAGASQLVACGVGHRRAAVEVVIASLPQHWGFLACSGVADLVRSLERAAPSQEDLRIARDAGCVSPPLASALASEPNAIDVNVPPEGTLLFEGDPVATIEGPLWQVWLAVDAISALVGRWSAVCTRAARLCLAGGNGNIVDASSVAALRAEDAVSIARSAYVGGAVATQSPAAAVDLGLDLRFAPSPEAVALSQDDGTQRTGAWAVQSSADDIVVDLGAGHDEEETLTELRRLGVARGSFAARGLTREPDGLRLRRDLVALEDAGVWTPRLGVIPDPSVHPGRKILVRYLDRAGRPIADVLHSVSERLQPAAEARIVRLAGVQTSSAIEGAVSAQPVLVTVLRSGRRVGPDDPNAVARRRLADALGLLPLPFKRLRYPSRFPVGLSPSLAALEGDLFAKLA